MATDRLGRRCQYGALLLLQLCILWFTCVLEATADFGVAFPIKGRESSDAETSPEDEDTPPVDEVESADMSDLGADRVTPADTTDLVLDSASSEQGEFGRDRSLELAHLRPRLSEAGGLGPSTTELTLQTLYTSHWDFFLFFFVLSVLDSLIAAVRGRFLSRPFLMTALSIGFASLFLSRLNDEHYRGPWGATSREMDREESSGEDSTEEKQ